MSFYTEEHKHTCELTVYSHTSYRADGFQDVLLCATDPVCPAWDYGPFKPYSKDNVVELEAVAARNGERTT